MPRGIPKDPNHPRNKKRQQEAAPAAAPKKRGRPPGSGKTAQPKNVATAAPSKDYVKKDDQHKPDVLKSDKGFAPPRIDLHTRRSALTDEIGLITSAVAASGTNNLAAHLEDRVRELSSINDKLFPVTEPKSEPEEIDEEPEAEPVQHVSQPVLVPPPAAPVYAAPTALPTPPAFIPPPFPSAQQ